MCRMPGEMPGEAAEKTSGWQITRGLANYAGEAGLHSKGPGATEACETSRCSL